MQYMNTGYDVCTHATRGTYCGGGAARNAALRLREKLFVMAGEMMDEKPDDLEVVMDLTEEWDKVFTPGSLVQGCAVVRTEFAAEHPDLVEEFLADYADSVALVNDDPAQAAKDIETAGIFPKAAIAEMAIPKCNICFITGDQMKTQLNAFYEIMFEAAPQSIGGTVPGDDFYFIVK